MSTEGVIAVRPNKSPDNKHGKGAVQDQFLLQRTAKISYIVPSSHYQLFSNSASETFRKPS